MRAAASITPSPSEAESEADIRVSKAARACDRMDGMTGPYYRESIMSLIETDPAARDAADACRAVAAAHPAYNLAQIGREAGTRLGRGPLHHRTVAALLGRPAPAAVASGPHSTPIASHPRSIMDDVPDPPPPSVRPKPGSAAMRAAIRRDVAEKSAPAPSPGPTPTPGPVAPADPIAVEAAAMVAVGAGLAAIRDVLAGLDRPARVRVRAWMGSVIGGFGVD